jgi:iron complex outermembrane recepter protein
VLFRTRCFNDRAPIVITNLNLLHQTEKIVMTPFKKTPLCAAITCALAVSAQSLVYAQATTPEKKQEALDEVVVTAQKITQSPLKVSASLTAISGDDLKEKGITDAKGLSDLIPNTQISQNGGSAVSINIRGIENTNTTQQGDPAAAFHLDGIYVARPQGAGAVFFDLDRIEVLRGPQGTLYGRNANAGVVNVISRAPSSKFEGTVGLELGSLNQQKLEATLNVPANASLAFRASIISNQRDGYSKTATAMNGFTKDRDNIDSQAIRLQALYKPSAQTSWLLGFDQSLNKATGPNYYALTNGIPTVLVDSSNSMQGKFDNSNHGLKSEFKTDIGFANLDYLFGYRRFTNNEDYNVGGFGLLTTVKGSQSSHEIRLSSNKKGPLQWVAGIYIFDEKSPKSLLDGVVGPSPTATISGRECLTNGSCFGLIQYDDTSITANSKAFFGQATYSIDPTMRLIAGVRSTKDNKARNGTFNLFGFAGQNFAEGSWSKTTYKIGVEKDLAANSLLYASYSTGFKSGGFNDGDARTMPTLNYKPEVITAF